MHLPEVFNDRIKRIKNGLLKSAKELPDSLDAFLPKESNGNLLSIRDSKEIIWQRYLLTQRQNLEESPDTVQGGYKQRWTEHQITDLGLKSGCMTYEQARSFLHEGLLSEEAPLSFIDSIFWLKIVQNQKNKGKSDPDKIGQDINMLENSILSQIVSCEDPIKQAFDLAWFLDSNPTLEPGLLQRMSGIVSGHLLNSLPEIGQGGLTGDEVKLKAIYYFLESSQRLFSGKSTDDQHLKKFRQLWDSMANLVPYFNPGVDSSYATARQLNFVGKNFDEESVVAKIFIHNTLEAYNNTKDKVRRSTAKLAELKDNHGDMNEREIQESQLQREIDSLSEISEVLVGFHVENSQIEDAYSAISQIKDTVHYRLAIVDIIRHEVKNGDLSKADKLFNQYFDLHLDRIKKQYYGPLSTMPQEELIKWFKFERRGWVFQWIIAGNFLADEGNYTIFNLPFVLQQINAGAFDFELDQFAKICNGSQETQALNHALDHRINAIFTAENNKESEKKDSLDQMHSEKALEALLILRGKNLSPSVE